MHHQPRSKNGGSTEPTEDALRRLHEAGDWAAVVTLALRAYGEELAGFLGATVRDEDEAADVFSDLCESLWRAVPGFRWQSSFKGWAYTIARHAAYRYKAQPHRRRRAPWPWSECPELAQAADHVRTTTLVYLRSEVKERVRTLRERLSPEDRQLLFLRLERGLPWDEIADVYLDGGVPLGPEERKRSAAMLRKRFERIKARVKALAEAEHLLSP